MAKKKIKLLITTTFKQYVDYELDEGESVDDALERANGDTDLYNNALDTLDFDTEITLVK